MNNITHLNKCTGCTACLNTCPKNAIEMKVNSEGFLYPVIDKMKCIDCGLCRKVCPINGFDAVEKNFECFACYNKNIDDRISSSSGGMFTLLATEILKNNGIVVGAAFDGNHVVNHILIDDLKDIGLLKGSKYVQSDLKNVFTEIKKYIKNKKILFVGTPCQVGGLKKFLKRDYGNLYCVDLICHGVPSPKVLTKYLDFIETKLDDKIENVYFRNKNNGWKNFTMLIKGKNNIYNKKFFEDEYMQLFLNNVSLRESCYNCIFKSSNNVSDMTLGDFWGIEKIVPEYDDDKGISAVIINTVKGKELFNSVSEQIIYKRVEYEQIITDNIALIKSVKEPVNRKKFFIDLENKSFDKISKKYNGKGSFIKRLLRKLCRIIKK